jgi:hypothetical protein
MKSEIRNGTTTPPNEKQSKVDRQTSKCVFAIIEFSDENNNIAPI